MNLIATFIFSFPINKHTIIPNDDGIIISHILTFFYIIVQYSSYQQAFRKKKKKISKKLNEFIVTSINYNIILFYHTIYFLKKNKYLHQRESSKNVLLCVNVARSSRSPMRQLRYTHVPGNRFDNGDLNQMAEDDWITTAKVMFGICDIIGLAGWVLMPLALNRRSLLYLIRILSHVYKYLQALELLAVFKVLQGFNEFLGLKPSRERRQERLRQLGFRRKFEGNW